MRGQIVDMAKLDAELRMGPAVSYAPKPKRTVPPLPEYVQHNEGISEVGAISAEAVVYQFELAAKALEEMGQETTKVVRRCEEIKANAINAMKQAEETATRYREEAKKAFEQIEQCALLTTKVSETCENVKRWIAGDTQLS
jgi:hypothetical protein